MERLRSACRLLSPGRRQGMGGHSLRFIYSKTGVWPVTVSHSIHTVKHHTFVVANKELHPAQYFVSNEFQSNNYHESGYFVNHKLRSFTQTQT